ncbi:sulfite exporter TauE/SafE family protein [Rhodococcus sp. ZPP]|uniref:sulfite exporter TauE/SafE family protein n=1 Tax=Rhodococcus sp. ZPP TaxID=2749906 RepID=UPI001AD86CC0|nr:sulfite exporter TauE/SafE family protein [Rhodococcus sp. ZPP]QTJ67018.1 sulfite exporter TauE/SafE family protein [Rhodococcus sp. ZPP]
MAMLILGALCIGIASVIGGATGFGTALIATPVMLMAGFDVAEVVFVNLVAGLVTRLSAAYQLRTQINWGRVALLGAGSLPGAWLGAVTLSMLPEQFLKPAAGALVMMCGVAMALPVRTETPRTPSTPALALTGAVGGYLGTTTSLNGPPPVLLLMRARLPPLSFIADLAGYFIVANVIALAILWFRDEVTESMIWPRLPVFVLAALMGNLIGLAIARRLSPGVFRSAVIVLVIAAGAVTLTVG